MVMGHKSGAISNIKILVWLQLSAITAAFVVAWFYKDSGIIAGPGVVEGIIYCAEDSSTLIESRILIE